MKKLAELKLGAHFMYGGVEWVKFEDIGAGTLCLAAEPVFHRVFDEENCIPAPECGSREISHLITGDELLRQTAEEAVELAQAALKVIRAAKGTTPLDGEDAVDMLVEEIADVQNCIAVLAERLTGLRDKADKISVEKMRRWRERLIASGGTT